MKVLLCSPYNASPEYEQGGIVMWANNIMGYYHTITSDVKVDVVQFNRKVRENCRAFSRILGGLVDYSTAIKTASKQMDKGYDVLHLCTSAQLSLSKDYFVLRKAKRKGIKTVIHLHLGRVAELIHNNNWEWKLLKRVIILSDAVVTMDLKSYGALRDMGYSKILYLPNPLSQEVMRQITEESLTVDREKRKLCFVGHVIPTKGVYELVEACKKIDDIKLYIIGRVALEVRSKLEAIAGKNDWLVFVGEVSHQRVIREMLSSSIFVLPSYTEGFPNVILESMASGCAIVSTTVGAIPEMLAINSEEPCGLCSLPKDVNSLRDNINFFLNNANAVQQYSERSLKRVNQLYVVNKVWLQLVNIWKNISQL